MVDVELTGALTLQSLKDAVGGMVARLDPATFEDIDQLYTQLNKRGSLTLRDATLTLPKDAPEVFLGLHRLKLINTHIYVCSSDLFLVCNEYQNDNTIIRSFPSDAVSAATGADGATPGAAGAEGGDGLSAGTVRVFVTDKIKSLGPIQIELDGQRGGRGGSGVPGAKGRKGGNGRNCANGTLDCRAGCGDGHPGQPGQQGGNAGSGGDGGDGGRAEYWLHGVTEMPERFFAFSAQGGTGGYPGVPGFGGEGGEGGDAGRSGCSQCSGTCRRGRQGPHGARGHDGDEGRSGVNQFLKRASFDVPYLRALLQAGSKDCHERFDSDLLYSLGTGLSERMGHATAEA